METQKADRIKSKRLGRYKAIHGWNVSRNSSGKTAPEKKLIDMEFKVDKNFSSVTEQKQNHQMLYASRIDFIYGLELPTFFGIKKAGLNPDMIERSSLMNGGIEYYYGFSLKTSDLVVEQFRKALERAKKMVRLKQLSINMLMPNQSNSEKKTRDTC